MALIATLLLFAISACGNNQYHECQTDLYASDEDYINDGNQEKVLSDEGEGLVEKDSLNIYADDKESEKQVDEIPSFDELQQSTVLIGEQWQEERSGEPYYIEELGMYFRNFTFKDQGFSFSYPADWSVSADGAGATSSMLLWVFDTGSMLELLNYMNQTVVVYFGNWDVIFEDWERTPIDRTNDNRIITNQGYVGYWEYVTTTSDLYTTVFPPGIISFSFSFAEEEELDDIFFFANFYQRDIYRLKPLLLYMASSIRILE